MKTDSLYAIYRKTAVPDETYPEYNAGYNLELAGHIIIKDGEQGYPVDEEEYEMVFIGSLPKESKLC
ncbi:MAG TPA: hypothetical protein VL443_24050 [Cyclobacteriaceae bacterium]|jgi:hypothetical protein|nr:hypothetical protein [Cyclobacteriaceae bacterium]